MARQRRALRRRGHRQVAEDNIVTDAQTSDSSLSQRRNAASQQQAAASWHSYFLEHGEGALQASADGINRALICMLLAAILAIVSYWRAARTARDDLLY
jgi:hypothetical protein